MFHGGFVLIKLPETGSKATPMPSPDSNHCVTKPGTLLSTEMNGLLLSLRPLVPISLPATPAPSSVPHSPVLPRLPRSLLGHQDVVLLRRVLLPVRELGAFALALLRQTRVRVRAGQGARGPLGRFGATRALPARSPLEAAPRTRPSPAAHPEQGRLLSLLVIQVLLDVEEGVEEDVGELAALQVVQRDLP